MSATSPTSARAAELQGADATRKLARHAESLSYEALPPPLVELTKQCILDTLGVSIGASTLAPEATIVADYVRDLGGMPQSTLLGFGDKAPAPWAVKPGGRCIVTQIAGDGPGGTVIVPEDGLITSGPPMVQPGPIGSGANDQW